MNDDLTTIARMTGVLDTGVRHPGALAADRAALRRARQRAESRSLTAFATTVGAVMCILIMAGLA